MTDPALVLYWTGGVARRAQLRRWCSRRQLARAVDEGRIVRVAKGRYALPTADVGRVAAGRLNGVASHTTAALHWGWAVKVAPADPHVTVPKHRRVDETRRAGVVPHFRDLRTDEVADGWVTTRVRTVLDCCLDLPFDEALAVFDSSWRAGLRPREVQLAALALPPRSRNRVLAVARAADARAANPFESVLRSIACGVPGLHVEPQVNISDVGFHARVDLADEELRIVVEAESLEFHGSRSAFEHDCRRYNGLVIRGWLVLRFTWVQVMFEPGLVAAALRAAVEQRRTRTRRTGSTKTRAARTA